MSFQHTNYSWEKIIHYLYRFKNNIICVRVCMRINYGTACLHVTVNSFLLSLFKFIKKHIFYFIYSAPKRALFPFELIVRIKKKYLIKIRKTISKYL